MRCLLLLVYLAVANAGVQRGLCYCNVGVCYKRLESGETVLCTTDEDFYGPTGKPTEQDDL